MNTHLAKAARCAQQATTAAERLAALMDKRNAHIIAARDDGVALREIAEATGVSHTTIATIVRKATKP